MRAHPPLPLADRGLVIKFGTIGLWAVLFAAFLPEAYRTPLIVALVTALSSVTVVGAAVAITGIVRRDNLVTEAVGLSLMLAGPAGYVVLAATVGVLGVLVGNVDRIAVTALALLQVEVIATRLAFLIDRRRSVKCDDVPVNR